MQNSQADLLATIWNSLQEDRKARLETEKRNEESRLQARQKNEEVLEKLRADMLKKCSSTDDPI
jgi:hypothetical protein